MSAIEEIREIAARIRNLAEPIAKSRNRHREVNYTCNSIASQLETIADKLAVKQSPKNADDASASPSI